VTSSASSTPRAHQREDADDHQAQADLQQRQHGGAGEIALQPERGVDRGLQRGVARSAAERNHHCEAGEAEQENEGGQPRQLTPQHRPVQMAETVQP
jgi:hypothetical protein